MDVHIHSFLDTTADSFLKSVPVASIMKTEKELVTLSPDDTIEGALKRLATNAISGAPVFDGIKQRFVGYLSVLDLCVWVVRTYNIAKGDKQELDSEKLNHSFSQPIINLLREQDIFLSEKELFYPLTPTSETGLEPYWPVHDQTSLATLIDNYFKWRIHRAPVVKGSKIVGHVSQSDVVAFLAQNAKQFEKLYSKKVVDLGLEEGPVMSVSMGMPLIEAFNQITETKFTGLAIIDDKGRLCNNISASDLKGITKESFWKLDMPVEKALNLEKQKLPPVTCKKEDTIGSVIKKLAEYRIHRTYVIDEERKPTNVITQTTVMKLFSHTGSQAFA